MASPPRAVRLWPWPCHPAQRLTRCPGHSLLELQPQQQSHSSSLGAFSGWLKAPGEEELRESSNRTRPASGPLPAAGRPGPSSIRGSGIRAETGSPGASRRPSPGSHPGPGRRRAWVLTSVPCISCSARQHTEVSRSQQEAAMETPVALLGPCSSASDENLPDGSPSGAPEEMPLLGTKPWC